MKTCFSENVFFVKYLSRLLTLLMAYYVLLRHPFSCLCDLNLIPQSNIRELMLMFVGMPDMFASLNFSVNVVVITIMGKYIHLSSFYGDLNISEFVLNSDLIGENEKISRLDMSNSFLYSGKTHSLLE